LAAGSLIFAVDTEYFGLELKRGLPSALSLAMSIAAHAAVVTLLMTVRFPPSAPALLQEAGATPTQIRIDKKLYYVARIEAQNRPQPAAPQKLANPVAAPTGKNRQPKETQPPKPMTEAEQVRQAVKRELARALIPPEVKRTPRAEMTLIQPMSPPDVTPPPVPLPTFRVMTPQLRRIPRRFVSPGQTAPRPPAQTPNVAPLPMELVSAEPVPSLTQARLNLPRTPPPPPEPVKTPEGPPSAQEGAPLNILSLSNRDVPFSDKLMIPPGNIAAESSVDDAGAAAAAQPASRTPSATPRAGGAASASASAASVNPAPETGIGRAVTGAGSGVAIAGPTASSGAVVMVGGAATGPSPAGATPGGSGVTITGAGSGTAVGTRAAGGGAAGGRIAPGQVITRSGGTYDTVVVQTSPVDQYPETRGLLTGRPIYSVYVSVGSQRDWTLFFCIPNERPAPNNTPVVQLGTPAIPVKAPYATKLMRPDIALPVYERYVLVHGFVSPEGRFEALRIVRSIRPEIDRALLATLTNWEFQPAQRQNAPVRVEFLLSIPARGL